MSVVLISFVGFVVFVGFSSVHSNFHLSSSKFSNEVTVDSITIERFFNSISLNSYLLFRIVC